jgi:hypothetical protein
MMPNRSGTAGDQERSNTAPSHHAADDEWDTLTASLNDLGVLHVAPMGRVDRRRRSTRSLDAAHLFDRLFTAADARLQQAAIVLLLTRPELAPQARDTIQRQTGRNRDRAMRRYVAAAAMQRMARTRIAMQLGPQPDLPPAFVAELGLPSLDEEYGRSTLLDLAQQEEQLYGYDAWGTYTSLLELFLSESRRRAWGRTCVSEPIARA